MFAFVMHETPTILQLAKGPGIQSTSRLGHKPLFTSYLHSFIWMNYLNFIRLGVPSFKMRIKLSKAQDSSED